MSAAQFSRELGLLEQSDAGLVIGALVLVAIVVGAIFVLIWGGADALLDALNSTHKKRIRGSVEGSIETLKEIESTFRHEALGRAAGELLAEHEQIENALMSREVKQQKLAKLWARTVPLLETYEEKQQATSSPKEDR